jgi:hypothetical protein
MAVTGINILSLGLVSTPGGPWNDWNSDENFPGPSECQLKDLTVQKI